MQKLWPILIVIGANVVYNICAKQTPEDVNSFFSLGITYVVAAALSFLLYFLTASGSSAAAEWRKTNWTAYVFGLCVVALEFGYLNIYRVGWKVSTASLVANIGLAVILLLVGALFYREVITLRQLIGMALCAAGLILIGGS